MPILELKLIFVFARMLFSCTLDTWAFVCSTCDTFFSCLDHHVSDVNQSPIRSKQRASDSRIWTVQLPSWRLFFSLLRENKQKKTIEAFFKRRPLLVAIIKDLDKNRWRRTGSKAFPFSVSLRISRCRRFDKHTHNHYLLPASRMARIISFNSQQLIGLLETIFRDNWPMKLRLKMNISLA